MNSTFRQLALAMVAMTALPLGSAFAGDSGSTSVIDKDGCEIVSGYMQVNNCNPRSRTDGTFRIRHDGQTFRAEGTGLSAYVTLMCAGAGITAKRGAVVAGDSFKCSLNGADYAQRSACGSAEVCGDKFK